MQSRSNLWKELAASGNVKMETVVVIDGREYAPKGDVAISRTAGQNALSIGNTITATVQFSVERVEGVTIPNTSAAVAKVRYVDGERVSEWMERGTFYVSRRQKNVVSDVLEFQGYDAMIKADAPYPSLSGFPKSMNGAVMEIARNMGVEVDGRTWTGFPTGADYYVPLPANGEKMIKVLGYIGGACGGNWIITPRNKLRLVPLVSASGAASASDKAEIVAVMSGITTGEPMTVTGVAVTGQNSMLAGTETGAVVTLAANPYITQATLNALLTRYNGLVYVPYEIKSGIYDPAAEIGDYLISREDIASVIWSESATYAPMFRGDLSAPFTPETSKTGRSVTDAISETAGGYEDLSVRLYKFVNQSAVTIADGQSAEIINFDYAAGSGQDVVFHAEIKHTTATTETGNSTNGWTCTDAVLTVTYYINGAEAAAYHPAKTETDGANLLHLNYQWANGKFTTGNFRAVLSLSGGGVTIAAGDARAYIIGQGYAGGVGDWVTEDGLVFVGVESYPEKMDYITGDTLDLTGLVVKAYYGDGTEKNVTADCVIDPAHGDALEEGENVVNISYTEDNKEYRDSFSVYCQSNNVIYIEVTTQPTRTEYFPGETLDLTGIVVTAFYEDGTEADVTEDCVFTPADETTLTGEQTITASAAYVEGGETFTAYFDIAVKTIRITAYPYKSDYFVGDALDYTGLEVTEAVSGGTWNDITSECAISPAEGTEVTEPGDIMVDVRHDGKSLGAFWVAVFKVEITTYPTKLDYAVGDTLDYTGLVITETLPDGTTRDITPYCTFDPLEGTEVTETGTIPVTVSYNGETIATFAVKGGVIASGDWWTLYDDGELYIYCEGNMPYIADEDWPWYNYREQITSAILSDGVTGSLSDAFDGCSNLESVTIGNGITAIGQRAFAFCFKLTSVIIPNSVMAINSGAFMFCTQLSSVTFGNNIWFIARGAFRGCSNLTNVTIPASVTKLGYWDTGSSVSEMQESVFCECYHLMNVFVENENANYTSIDGVLFDKVTKTLIDYPAGKESETYVMPDGFTTIAENAFSYSCFKNVVLPSSVTAMGKFAFYRSNVVNITIPQGVTTIPYYAFYMCYHLKSVTIPDSVTSVQVWAFDSCDRLTDVYYAGTESQWNAITISSGNDPLTGATIRYNSAGPT